MALKLLPNRNGDGYRPFWYGQYRDNDGKPTTVALGVRVRGTPPPNFRDAPECVGDKEFERSRATANTALDKRMKTTAEFKAERRAAESERGEAVREYMKIVELKTGKAFVDHNLADLAAVCLERRVGNSPAYTSLARNAFRKFAEFAAAWTPSPVTTVLGVTQELALAFVKDIAARYSWSTTKEYCRIMSGTFNAVLPRGVDNPFEGVRRRVVANMKTDEDGERKVVEKTIHHIPLDRAQVRKVWAEAKDPMLHDLAVTSACTGLRISDCCLLKWSSIDLDKGMANLTTQKTGANVALPIFDHDPDSLNYEPDLGEFRRVLEGRLAEREPGGRYVFPEAAREYKRRTLNENGDILYPGRDLIYSRGKALFARALFADDAEDRDPEAEKRTPEEVVALIDAANWTEDRRARVKDIYSRYAEGQTYRAIQAATGYSKSTISYDLGAVERLAAVKVKPRADKPSMKDLLDKTRQARAVGVRSASLYSWHSLRCSFVVMAVDNDIPLDIVRQLVGHADVEMTLTYYNPTQFQAAEKARQILAQRNAHKKPFGSLQDAMRATLPLMNADAPDGGLNAFAAMLDKLTTKQRGELATLLNLKR